MTTRNRAVLVATLAFCWAKCHGTSAYSSRAYPPRDPTVWIWQCYQWSLGPDMGLLFRPTLLITIVAGTVRQTKAKADSFHARSGDFLPVSKHFFGFPMRG
jgi:hypothetical protein